MIQIAPARDERRRRSRARRAAEIPGEARIGRHGMMGRRVEYLGKAELIGELIGRLGAATALGLLFPPAALPPLIDIGLGEHNACTAAYAAQQPPGNPQPRTDNVPR
jgi:hypothetical protein